MSADRTEAIVVSEAGPDRDRIKIAIEGPEDMLVAFLSPAAFCALLNAMGEWAETEDGPPE